MTEKTGIDKELSDLRTEVYEARNLVIKSDNLLRTLHAEMKAVGKTQERFERRQLVSSVAAYVIFAVLAAGAGVFVSLSTSSAARSAAEEAIVEAESRIEAAEAEAAEAAKSLQARLEAEEVATAVHRRILSDSQEDRAEALEELDGVDMSLVPEIVRELIFEQATDARREIVMAAWDRGRRAYLAERMEEAAEHLGLVVRHSRHLPPDFEPTARATAAYYLGAAQNRLGAHEDAVEALRAYLSDENASRATLAYAHLLLGDSLSGLRRLDEAREAFRSGIEAEPGGRHAQLLRRRMDALGDGEREDATAAE